MTDDHNLKQVNEFQKTFLAFACARKQLMMKSACWSHMQSLEIFFSQNLEKLWINVMMIDDQKRQTLRSKGVDWDTEATGLDAGDWITEASTLNPWAKRTPTLILELRGPLLELPWMYLHEYSENKHISSYHKVIWSNWYSPLLL